MNLYRSVVLIEKNKGNSTKNYELAVVLKNVEDEVLVAQLEEATLNAQNRFVLRASYYTKLKKDVTFQNAIYTVPEENIIESLFKINFVMMQAFIDNMHLNNLLPMNDRDFGLLLSFLESHNKRVIKEGSVIITKINDEYKTYFVSKKKEDFMEVYSLEYDYKVGLSISSFEPLELPYRFLLIERYYLREHEEQLRQTLKSKSLKLIRKVNSR